MCKVMIMSGITDETKDKAWEFIKAISKEMSSPNVTEKDGLGYAAIDNEGKLFGERWVKNDDAFKHRNPFGTEIDSTILKQFKILRREKVYGNFGVFNDNIRSITLHSRMATNTVNYKNTHPFVEGFTSVIHNGVIYNDDKLTKKYSTCDSEVILHEYIKSNVNNKLGKFKKVANKLDGYYVLGILSKTNEGRVILDIVKDSRASLDAFFIKELNTIVFATPKYNGSPVEDACKSLGFTIVSKYEVVSNRVQRFDALTGEAIACESFSPKKNVVVNEKTQPSYKGYTEYDSSYNSSRKHSWENHEMYPYNKDEEVYVDRHGRETFKDIFPKGSNVLPMSTMSRTVTEEDIKERLLEEMVVGDKEYTQEEIDTLIKNSNKIADELEKTSSNFNDDSGVEWWEDDKFTWHKKIIE